MKTLVRVLLLAGIATFLSLSVAPQRPAPEVHAASMPAPSGASSSVPGNYDFNAGEPVVSGPTNFGFEDGLNNWTVVNGSASTQSGGYEGNYLHVSGNASLNPKVVSTAFTVESEAPFFSFWVKHISNGSWYRLELATGPSYSSWTQVAGGSSSPSSWLRKNVNLSSYVGQSVKIRYSAYLTTGFDEGAMRELPGWKATTGSPYWETYTIPASTVSAGDFDGTGDRDCSGSANYAYRTGVAVLPLSTTIESLPFTIPDDAEQMDFRAAVSGSSSSLSVSLYVWDDEEEEWGSSNVVFNRTGFSTTTGIYTTCHLDDDWQGKTVKIRVASSTPGTVRVALAGQSLAWLMQAYVDQSDDPVSFATGHLTHSHTDLAIPGKGFPLAFSRSYSSAGSAIQSNLGWGWHHNYESKLQVLSSNDVQALYPDGRRAFFDESSGTYSPPMGVYDELVQNVDDSYTLTTPSQIELNFDEDGLLTSMVDRNGNETALSYTSGLLETVTSAGGSTLSFTYDEDDRVETVTDDLEREVTYGYDAEGDLVSVTDVKGGETTFTYESHRLISITDALDQLQVTNIYDGAGRVVEQTDAVDGVTCFYYGTEPAYSSANCPGVDPEPEPGQTIMVDPRGGEEIHQFDTAFRPTAVQDAEGNVTIYTYEASGALCSPANNGNLCSITDPVDGVTEFTYDSAGNRLTTTNPLDKTWTNTYTVNNEIETSSDPLDRVTEYIYDESRNLTRIVREDDSTNVMALSCLEYDGDGLITAAVASTDLEVPAEETDQCTGNRTLSGYDANGWLVCQVGARFATTSDDCDELTTKTTFEYDDGGRLTYVTNELRQPVSTPESGGDCGALGAGDGEDDDSDTVADDGCPSMIYTYDAQNNVTSVTDAEGNVTAFGYDAKGQRTSITDANRATVSTPESGEDCGEAGTGDGDDDDSDTVVDDGCLSTLFGYDAAGRLSAVIDALGNRTSYGYDANHNRTSVTNPLRQPVSTPETGEDCGAEGTGDGIDDDSDTVADDGCPSTIYIYDDADRLESETDALGRVTSYTHNADSTVATRTDARGLTTEYTYDAGKRLQLIEYFDGETLIDDVDYNYDDLGNRTSMVDSTGTTSYQYDDLNRLTSATFPGPKTVAYRYDNTGAGGEDPAEYPGQRTKITYPDSKSVVYAFEADGRMSTVTDWMSNVTSYTYDDAGRLEGAELPNGVTTAYSYDAADRLVELVNEDDTPSTLSSYEYTLDAVGNRTQAVDTNGTTDYDYDALYQLTGVTYPDDDDQVFSYDAMGNRLTMQFNETTTEYEYDAADQLLSVDEVSYAYDENGNQTERGGDTFEWDHENRLVESTISSTVGTYAYSGDGLRTNRTTGMVSVSYVWDVGASMPIILQDSQSNTYVYGLDLISRTDSEGDQQYYVYDGLGSTTGLSDETGSVIQEYEYDVFGTVRAETGSSPNEFMFTGEQTDPTGLEYLRARYYDGQTGRFLSRDPLKLSQRYPYVANNSVNLVDPYGLLGCDDVPIFGGACEEVVECAGDLVECGRDIGGWVLDKAKCVLVTQATGLSCDQLDAIFTLADSIATNIACGLNKESYFDLNVTVPVKGALAVIGGAQVSCEDGLHFYGGAGAGAGIAVTVAPNQSIAEGPACGAQGGLEAVAVNWGIGTGGEFREIGPGTTGASVGCVIIGPRSNSLFD